MRPRTSASRSQRWRSQGRSARFFGETARAAASRLAEAPCRSGMRRVPLGHSCSWDRTPRGGAARGPAGVAGVRSAARLRSPLVLFMVWEDEGIFLLVLTFSGHELSPLRARKSIFYEIIPLEVKRRSTISPGRRKETCLHCY